MTNSSRILEGLNILREDMAVVKDKLPGISQDIGDHEKRIRSIDMRLNIAAGMLIILNVLTPIILKITFPELS